MTKLKLNLAHEAGEILTREELKKIVGGTDGSGSGSTGSCSISFDCNNNYGVTGGGTISCSDTSDPFECEYVTMEKNGVTYTIGVKCNGQATNCVVY